MFITFEGPEGSGKSTQVALVADQLRAAGMSVVTTREPGGTTLGEQLRALLLESEHVPAAATEAYLMTAARAEHVREVILPALERGDWVLCDRFFDSTLAYQGAGRGLDVEALRELQQLALCGVIPDRTYLLDIDVIEGLRRRDDGGDRNRIDEEAVSFHERVAAWYRSEAEREPDRWRVVDAGKPVAAVFQEITADLLKCAGLSNVVS